MKFQLFFDGDHWPAYDTNAPSREEAEAKMTRKFCRAEHINFDEVSSLQGAVNCSEDWGPEYKVEIRQK